MYIADFSVYDRTGRLTAVAEAKQKRGITRSWATKWARNFLARGTISPARYLLLVTPENIYLWNRPNASGPSEPTHVLEANAVFNWYPKNQGGDSERISAQGFELLVATWLDDLLHHDLRAAGVKESNPLVSSGLIEAVEGGRVRSELEL